jgi:hypothetical protein
VDRNIFFVKIVIFREIFNGFDSSEQNPGSAPANMQNVTAKRLCESFASHFLLQDRTYVIYIIIQNNKTIY